MPETVAFDVRRELAEELADVLAQEVEFADEYHSTEQTMDEGADHLRAALESRADPVRVEMRRGLAEELADVLDHEVATADEFHSTEQIMEEGAEAVRRGLND